MFWNGENRDVLTDGQLLADLDELGVRLRSLSNSPWSRRAELQKVTNAGLILSEEAYTRGLPIKDPMEIG
jgi:hypothetical protein